MEDDDLREAYKDALLDYCTTHEEDALYRAAEISSSLIRLDLGPDEIVALHYDAVQQISTSESIKAADRIRILSDAHQFLLEVMIGYGARYKEFLDLKLDLETRRAETAERSELDKLEILAMIAHELGNPLTVAIGNMRIASRYLEAEDLVAMRDIIAESRTALDRLATLTRQIINASRDRQPEMDFEPVNLVPIAKQAVAWVRQEAESKGLALDACFERDLVFINGGSDELLSVFTNLLTNALRYTPAGGRIMLSLQLAGDEVRVAVRDTGMGISPEDQSRIFEKFFRSAEARTQAKGGLGMGLTIVNNIVRAHGGRIALKSRIGEGSTFTVSLPLLALDQRQDEAELLLGSAEV